MSQLLEIEKVFTTLALKQVFWKTKTFFKKLVAFFLAESSTIKSATFPHQISLSKVNVKINRMKSKKWTYLLIFLKIWFEYNNHLHIVDIMYQVPKYP